MWAGYFDMRFAPYYTCNENADNSGVALVRSDLHRIEINPELPFAIKYDNQGRVCCEFTQQNYNYADLPYSGDDAGFAGEF